MPMTSRSLGNDVRQREDLASCGLAQREQAIAESVWRSQEKDLERRVALLEALLRRSSGLDRPEVQPSQRGEPFSSGYEGPFVMRGQAPEDGIYFSRAPVEATASTSERPMSRLLAGDFESVTKYFGF
ncbi:unnamed protein product [Effrenium voratum]|nr:unnamed protein product [Effrenium voratum]